ncbi:MAG: hypothetical protein JNM24_13255 [Bdellovibrionaceae bacterium]|nr:hypothetical protein [Pseudobdellovibrionaceae bacterium]
MTNIKLIIALFTFSFFVFAEADQKISDDVVKQVKKFEDLFIWKVSEELKLTQKEETLVSEIIKETNRKKQESNAHLEALYRKMNQESAISGKKDILNKIRSLHKEQLSISLEEIDRLNKGIGIKKLGLYLEIKRDLSEKIKNVWSQNEKKPDKALPAPKVIEER